MEQIISFLKRNGFEKMEAKSYANYMCNVVFEEHGFAVADNDGLIQYSDDFSLYWLIGVLTYNGYIDKNYNK